MQCFSSSKVLECHLKRLLKSPFIIYRDLECALIRLTNNIDFGRNTEKYQSYILFAVMATNWYVLTIDVVNGKVENFINIIKERKLFQNNRDRIWYTPCYD